MSDDRTVYHLRSGHAIAAPGQPDPAVVKELEDLLQQAKSGEISGLAWAATHPAEISSNHYVGMTSRGMVGGLFSVMRRISEELDK